ncbi:MAG: preprotein translocase subunit SecD [Methanobrevibacter sp.]|nr:preprotein translocase subunit SecD [Methanobrevibacter sp.]
MAGNLSKFFKDKRVIILLIFLIISIVSISFLGVEQGLDLKGGSSIQLELEHPVNQSTMDLVTSVLDKRLNLFGVTDVKVRSSGDQMVIVEMAGKSPEEVEKLIGNPGIFEAKIDNKTVLTGSDVASVEAPIVGESGEWQVPFTLTTDGAKKFAELAKGKGGHEVIMYLDGRQIDEHPPSLSDELASGEAVTEVQVTGGSDSVEGAKAESNEVYTVLKTGSLPVKIHTVGSNTVSPELGQQFAQGAVIAGLLAILGIAFVVYIRYRKAFLAIPILITTISEIIIILGIASIIHWNIDLAAIAGLIASVGTGVDDQIIITDEVLHHDDENTRHRRTRTQMNVKNALFIIFASAGTLIAAMLPLAYVGFSRGSSGIGTIAGFAFTTIIGVLIGVFITRPAYAKFIEIFVS